MEDKRLASPSGGGGTERHGTPEGSEPASASRGNVYTQSGGMGFDTSSSGYGEGDTMPSVSVVPVPPQNNAGGPPVGEDGGEDVIRRVHNRHHHHHDHVEVPPPPRLSYFTRIVASSGHILNDLCASLWFSYFLLYMQKVAGFSDRNAAILMLLGQVVDGVSTPLIGYEADRAHHFCLCKKSYGRCKAWHLFGVILVVISFPFVFSPCIGCENSSEWARAVYYAPFITIFQIGWAASQISHLALIPKISGDELLRTELLAIRYAFTVSANITVFLLTWITLGFKDCEIDKDDGPKFRLLALVAVGIGLFFSVLFHYFVVEKSDEEAKRINLQDAARNIQEAQATKGPGARKRSDFLESLQTVTNVRSVTSSMAISKVHAQARQRRSSSYSTKSGTSRGDKEAGQSLLSDHDDMEDPTGAHRAALTSSNESGSTRDPSLRSEISSIHGPEEPQPSSYSFQQLQAGKEVVTVKEWLTMPQFYIVALMYMGTRLNVNITQSYIPLYLQETLKLNCGSVATVPLTMFCAGLVVSIFIKIINKYLGRQLAYCLGASMCVIAGGLILGLDWTPGSALAEKGIYGVAVLLGGGASAILVTSLAITADMIGSNVESGAFVYGAMSFCDKLSCGLAVMLINELRTMKRFEKDQNFYQRVLGYTTAGCSTLGVLGVIGLTYIICKQQRERARPSVR